MSTPRTKNGHTGEAQPPQEAFDYVDDVTEQAVKIIQEKADRAMEKGKWTVVEGYKFG